MSRYLVELASIQARSRPDIDLGPDELSDGEAAVARRRDKGRKGGGRHACRKMREYREERVGNGR